MVKMKFLDIIDKLLHEIYVKGGIISINELNALLKNDRDLSNTLINLLIILDLVSLSEDGSRIILKERYKKFT